MSCCNEKIKDSDLIDLSFVEDPCTFNDVIRNFLDVQDVQADASVCCDLKRFIVRFEELSDDRVLYTFEDTEKRTVDFVVSRKINSEQSAEDLFKQLTAINSIVRSERIQTEIKRVCIGDGLNEYRYTENVSGYRLIQKNNPLSLLASLSFNTVEKENHPDIPETVVYRYLETRDGLILKPIVTVLLAMEFKAVKVETFGHLDKTTKFTFIKKIDEHVDLQLDFTHVSSFDREHIDVLNEYKVIC